MYNLVLTGRKTMQILTNDSLSFSLVNDLGNILGSIRYLDDELKEATLHTEHLYQITNNKPGVWTFIHQDSKEISGRMKVSTGGKIIVESKRLRFWFFKTMNWNLRFVLLNKEGEELMALKPAINWKFKTHDFILQLNEELTTECSSFLILQALHCARCSLGMMYDKTVPPIVCVY